MMRLLFVDDDPRVLDGLRQSLRTKRKLWEMVFAVGPTVALERLAEGPFDAVISDMRMPILDGAGLLKRVQELQPQALRIVLSGQMDEFAAVRAAAVAHRFLVKPCDSEMLIATLSAALDLRAQLNSDEMRECIGGMTGLPSLPRSCAELNLALEREDAGIATIAKIVEGDVGMAAKLLQLVNSAFFGLSRRIVNIEQAVSYLGTGVVRSLVIGNAFFEQLLGGDVQLLEAELRHSVLAAKYAKAFELGGSAKDIAVTAAFLHNVGRLALISKLPDEYNANREYAKQHGLTIEEAERTRLGVTHSAVGAHLLGLWGLPREVIEAVGSPATPVSELRVLDASAVVRLTDILAGKALGRSDYAEIELPADALARLGVSAVVAGILRDIDATRSVVGAA